MARNKTDESKSMYNVSPFTIQKSIELQVGEPKSIKRLRNVTLLIESFNKKLADKLCLVKLLGTDIHVKTYEHPTLNQSKGTIYCPDLIYDTDEVILKELKSQFVTEVIRIKKTRNNEKIDTGVFILTFNITELPEKLIAGFHSCEVKLLKLLKLL